MNRIYQVLIVDDEPQILQSLRRTLSGEGMNILMAPGPQEALDLLKVQAIDVVISDHDMPGMKGLDMLQTIRLSRPHIVRILLTGRSDLTLAIRALNEGAVHKFLLKPWDRVDLRGMLNLALRSVSTTNTVSAPAPDSCA